MDTLTMLAVGNMVSALMKTVFPFFSPLQAQTFFFGLMLLFSYFVIARVMGVARSMVLHIMVLGTPTIAPSTSRWRFATPPSTSARSISKR